MMLAARMKRELEILSTQPPHGVSCWPVREACVTELEASLAGPADSPFAGGTFRLSVTVPARYPFEPPKVHFLTRVYHPNIDDAGRICLDLLKMPPAGAWKPALNIATVLTSLSLLLAEPNADDPLMPSIASELKFNAPLFRANARAHTLRYATKRGCAEGPGPGEGERDAKRARPREPLNRVDTNRS